MNKITTTGKRTLKDDGWHDDNGPINGPINGTPKYWEPHRSEPDAASTAYLRVITAEPDTVRQALLRVPA